MEEAGWKLMNEKPPGLRKPGGIARYPMAIARERRNPRLCHKGDILPISPLHKEGRGDFDSPVLYKPLKSPSNPPLEKGEAELALSVFPKYF
jgi:hypothetical protein